MIQGLIVLNNPTYVPQRWQGTLLFYAVILFGWFSNTFLVKLLPKIESLVLIIHIGGFFGVLIPLVSTAPHGSASEVFGHFENGGGWSTQGLSFFVGIVTGVYSFLGQCCPKSFGTDGHIKADILNTTRRRWCLPYGWVSILASMLGRWVSADCQYTAEEIPNASTVVPWIMIATAILNGVLGFAALIAILFSAGNVENAEKRPTGYPFIEIFYQATNSTGGATAMVCVILALVFFATISLIATASRMTWAFARDNGLPGSNWLAKVYSTSVYQSAPVFIDPHLIVHLYLGRTSLGSTSLFYCHHGHH